MSSWPSAKARRVFAARKRIGWGHDRTVGSHKIMKKEGWPDYPFSFHDSEELGPAVLAKISKKTAFNPAICNRVGGAPGSLFGSAQFVPLRSDHGALGKCRCARNPAVLRVLSRKLDSLARFSV